jgi:transposase
MTNEGAVNGRIFLAFVKQRLTPWLRPGDIVVLDNLNFHKMLVVRQAIEAAGAMPIYLPTYSPELNPIELLWSDLKRELRRMGLDTVNLLRWAIRRLRSALPLHRVDGWFRHTNDLAEAQLK